MRLLLQAQGVVCLRRIAIAAVAVLIAVMCHDAAFGQAAAPTASAPSTAAQTGETSYLSWIVHTSGWIGGVLLLMSFFMVAKVIECLLEFRASIQIPKDLLEEWEQMIQARDIQAIYNSARESDCAVGTLVASGLSAASGGLAEAREAIDRTGETLTVHMERKISMLAVVGSLGPLIGLLGTLKGMISSFSVIARSDTQMKASEVAGGISEALLITFEGVTLSVPAIFFFAYFRNQIASLSIDAMNQAEVLMRRIVGHKKPSPAAQPSATA